MSIELILHEGAVLLSPIYEPNNAERTSELWYTVWMNTTKNTLKVIDRKMVTILRAVNVVFKSTALEDNIADFGTV